MRAREGGEGSFIDCSMLGALLGVAALQTSEYFGTGQSGRRIGSAHPRNAPYQAYRASDDYFIIAAGNDALWRQVAEAVGLPDLPQDPRFRTQPDRARNQGALAEILEERSARREHGSGAAAEASQRRRDAHGRLSGRHDGLRL
jgi:succinate---hydroxymethylglutarate CoA-transferase